MADDREALLTLTADIVAAHVSNNSVAVGDLACLIGNVHKALAGLGSPAPDTAAELQPAVSVRASVRPDHIVCLEDGKKVKMLKRHLRTAHDLSPAAYRARWGLTNSYPMVAPAYAETRRALALKIGLGQKKASTVSPAMRAGKPSAAKAIAGKAAKGPPRAKTARKA